MATRVVSRRLPLQSTCRWRNPSPHFPRAAALLFPDLFSWRRADIPADSPPRPAASPLRSIATSANGNDAPSSPSPRKSAPKLGILVSKLFALVHPDRLASHSETSAAKNAASLAAMNEVLVALKTLPVAPYNDKERDTGQKSVPDEEESSSGFARAVRALPTQLDIDFDVPRDGDAASAPVRIIAVRSSVPLRAPDFLVQRELVASRERKLRQRRSSRSLPPQDSAAETARVHLQFASCALELALYKIFPGCGLEVTPAMKKREQTLQSLVFGGTIEALDAGEGEIGSDGSPRQRVSGAHAEMNRARAEREFASLTQAADPEGELRGLLQVHMSSLQKDTQFTDEEMHSLHTRMGDMRDTPEGITSRKRLKFLEARVPRSVSRHTVDAWLSPFDTGLVFVEDGVPGYIRTLADDAVFRHGREVHQRACANLPLAVDTPKSKVEQVMDAEADEIISARNHDWSGVSIMLAADDEDLDESMSAATHQAREALRRDGWVVVPASALAKISAAQEFDGGKKSGIAFNAAVDHAARELSRQMSRAQAYRDARRASLRRCASLQQMIRDDVLGCREVVLGSDSGPDSADRDALNPFDAERLLSEVALNPAVFEALQQVGTKSWRHVDLRIVGPKRGSLVEPIVYAAHGAICIVAAPELHSQETLLGALAELGERKIDAAELATVW